MKAQSIKIILLWLTISFMAAKVMGQNITYPFQDYKLPFNVRVKDIVERLSLDEKISLMQNESFPINRFDIPYYNWSGECLHGICNDGSYSTVFPQAIGMAATWDTDLILKESDIISTEARAWYLECVKNNNILGGHKSLTCWSPNINIFRDPRWGRGQETYGEDPYLTSRIGVYFVKGLQGNDAKYFKIISTPKHFAIHSGPESMRHKMSMNPGVRDLFETYLPAFEACIKEGKAYSIMGAYTGFQKVPCCANATLLDKILRKKWGFEGYVVSDCGAIWDMYSSSGHKFTNDVINASALSVKAGCDITCGTEYAALKDALTQGLINKEDIDIAVGRLLMARMKLGMFDPPQLVPYSNIPINKLEAPEHRQMALQVACESIVLLKNEKNILPLKFNKIKSLAVIGPYINRDDILYGNYNGKSAKPVTFLQGIKNRVGSKIKILSSKGVVPYDEGGALTTVQAKYVKPSKGSGNGLYGEYFNNPELEGQPAFSRVDTNMAPYWDKNSPGEGVGADFFSVRWTGTLTAPESGTYILGVISDDRGRLYFNDKLVIDNWRPCQINVMKTYKTKLEKGVEYNIRLEYADSVEYAGIRFQWKKDYSDDDPTEEQALFKKAIEITNQSDAAIVFAGISANLEGEEMSVNIKGFSGGDRTSLDLPDNQEMLIKALKETGKPIILVLTSGSALAVNWENENIPAILQAWYPGEEGGNAVADILFGNYNPSGRLPVTFYKSLNDLPPFENYDMAGRTYRYFNKEVLFPFGYGLSYTNFTYSDLKFSRNSINANDSLYVTAEVKNTGFSAGDEVVQLYLKNESSSSQAPLHSLQGFKRLHLKPGEVKKVEFLISPRQFSIITDKNQLVVESGTFKIYVGGSQPDVIAKKIKKYNGVSKEIQITGPENILEDLSYFAQ